MVANRREWDRRPCGIAGGLALSLTTLTSNLTRRSPIVARSRGRPGPLLSESEKDWVDDDVRCATCGRTLDGNPAGSHVAIPGFNPTSGLKPYGPLLTGPVQRLYVRSATAS